MGYWNDTLCGYGTETSLDDALCETFTTLYNTVGGIGSGAMIAFSTNAHRTLSVGVVAAGNKGEQSGSRVM
jgi:hypothetical protein